MRLGTRQWIQVVSSMLLAIWIFWFLYKDVSVQQLWAMLAQTSYFWLGSSLLLGIAGYWLRAWRWKLLIEAGQQDTVSTGRAFSALMIGYLTNLLIPRAGELSRCGVLAKTDEIQMGKLLGTVVLERTIDILLLVLTIFVAFLWERETFVRLFGQLFNVEAISANLGTILPIAFAGIFVAALLLYMLLTKYRQHSLVTKVRHFLREFMAGILSARRVENQWAFWGSSIGIWILYYLMMVLVAWAFPATASLAYSSILIVMVMGSIGMVAPVQGGIGTFHALVAFILMVYGLGEEEGKLFAAIVHGSQLLVVLQLGLLSLGYFLKITTEKVSKSY